MHKRKRLPILIKGVWLLTLAVGSVAITPRIGQSQQACPSCQPSGPSNSCCKGGCRDGKAALSPRANGSFVRRFQRIQSAKAERSDFVVFLNEWYMGGTRLGPYGRYHMAEIARRLKAVPFPVKIQPCADSIINQMRRDMVVQHLVQLGVHDADVRVVIAFPQAEGLRYEDVERIWLRSLVTPNETNNGVNGIGINAGGFGGSGFFQGGFFNRFSPFSGARPLFSGF